MDDQIMGISMEAMAMQNQPTWLRALQVISETPFLTMAELGQRVEVTRQRAHQIVDDLHDRRLVDREFGRARSIRITERGRRALRLT
jgi:DNA-binding MarR family transcriptional regulator